MVLSSPENGLYKNKFSGSGVILGGNGPCLAPLLEEEMAFVSVLYGSVSFLITIVLFATLLVFVLCCKMYLVFPFLGTEPGRSKETALDTTIGKTV